MVCYEQLGFTDQVLHGVCNVFQVSKLTLLVLYENACFNFTSQYIFKGSLTSEIVGTVVCRMFVDALDAQFYEKHNQSGQCYLSLSKVTFFYFNNFVRVFVISGLQIPLRALFSFCK